MGLDMYLYKRTYVKRWNHTSHEGLYTVQVLRGGKPVDHIKPERVAYIWEEVAYWRKANHIHKWFVDNVGEGIDDCKDLYLRRDELENLLDVCERVSNNPESAPELLPTTVGFFFGGTEYDEYYFEEVEDTIKTLKEILSEPDDDADFCYRASW